MAPLLPKFILLKDVQQRCYADQSKQNIVFKSEDVFNQQAKIELERASDPSYFHIRCCYNNKYWVKNDYLILASSDKPEEDSSKWSCTLFEFRFLNDETFHLFHVASNLMVKANFPNEGSWNSPRYLFIYDGELFASSTNVFSYFDWESLVKLPKNIVFKGYNDKYLQGIWFQGCPYLQLSSDDGNEISSAYEVQMRPDGHIRIKSQYFGKYWRRSPNWIWADSEDSFDKDTLFWPVKIDKSTIALKNAGNNNFCKSLSVDFKEECLNAAVGTITQECRLKVEELVLAREVYDVVYRMEDARIYDEQPIVAGRGESENDLDTESELEVMVHYDEYSSFQFSNSYSITAGLTTKIEAGFPFIAGGEIDVSVETTKEIAWNTAKEDSKGVSVTCKVKVPPKKKVRVNYVATKGTCDVPFSYVQRDKSSHDGQYVTSQHTDGVYTGVNYYSFHFGNVEIY